MEFLELEATQQSNLSAKGSSPSLPYGRVLVPFDYSARKCRIVKISYRIHKKNYLSDSGEIERTERL
jgi:hypothetical protein